jgi:hypothetical protein
LDAANSARHLEGDTVNYEEQHLDAPRRAADCCPAAIGRRSDNTHLDWITALRAPQVRQLVEASCLATTAR